MVDSAMGLSNIQSPFLGVLTRRGTPGDHVTAGGIQGRRVLRLRRRIGHVSEQKRICSQASIAESTLASLPIVRDPHFGLGGALYRDAIKQHTMLLIFILFALFEFDLSPGALERKGRRTGPVHCAARRGPFLFRTQSRVGRRIHNASDLDPDLGARAPAPEVPSTGSRVS